MEVARDRLHGHRDPNAAFAAVYAIITREVAKSIRDNGGVFLEPAWVSRLAGRFCERYLQTLGRALAGRAQDCGAWSVSYRHPALHATPPILVAVLGLNAHINYDLAIGIHQNILELGGAEDARRMARYRHDHDAVNQLLERSIPESFDRLIRLHGCGVTAFLSRRAPGPTRWLIMTVLRRWRARVWVDVEALLAAAGDAERRAILRRMDARSSRIARALLPGFTTRDPGRRRGRPPSRRPAPWWTARQGRSHTLCPEPTSPPWPGGGPPRILKDPSSAAQVAAPSP